MSTIFGVIARKTEAFSRVKDRPRFTPTAWALVIGANLLAQLGAHAMRGSSDPVRWVSSAVLGTAFVVAAFYIAVAVIDAIGRQAFHAQVTRDQLVRTLGLASVWNSLGVLGVLALLSPSLTWVVGVAQATAFVLFSAASLVAAKETMGTKWMPVIVSVVVAWVVAAVVLTVAQIMWGLFGFAGPLL